MKRYTDLTVTEKFALTDDEFYAAVKIEAIERGIKPPVSIEGIIEKVGYTGFSTPPDAIMLYEIMAPGDYHGQFSETGLCFKSAEAARAAMNGVIAVSSPAYNTHARKIQEGEFSVRQLAISLAKPEHFRTKITEEETKNEDFDKLCEECRDDLSALKQAKYNREVALRKRAEYLSLADNNEEIARRFWTKTESGEFPEPDNQ